MGKRCICCTSQATFRGRRTQTQTKCLRLKEKFFNKPDTLTQEKKSLGEAIKSGGMLKSARRKKGAKTDTEKESLIESMLGGGNKE